MACGLIRASFVPEERFQDLRSLMRARKQLSREQTSHVQRLQKTLEEANIKLDSVISDLLGVSGRRMLEAMIAGETDPSTLAALAHRGLKASPEELAAALKGRLTDHHRFLLKLYLDQRDSAEEAIQKIDREVDDRISRWTRRRWPGRPPFAVLWSFFARFRASAFWPLRPFWRK